MVQCTRCWKYGDKVHPSCQIRCRQCGRQHKEAEHSKECTKYAKADINHKDQKKGLTVCSHPISCANCRDNYHADDRVCCMRDHAVCEECQRHKIGQGQTMISKYLETTSS